jgi:hypothetical protein
MKSDLTGPEAEGMCELGSLGDVDLRDASMRADGTSKAQDWAKG